MRLKPNGNACVCTTYKTAHVVRMLFTQTNKLANKQANKQASKQANRQVSDLANMRHWGQSPWAPSAASSSWLALVWANPQSRNCPLHPAALVEMETMIADFADSPGLSPLKVTQNDNGQKKGSAKRCKARDALGAQFRDMCSGN